MFRAGNVSLDLSLLLLRDFTIPPSQSVSMLAVVPSCITSLVLLPRNSAHKRIAWITLLLLSPTTQMVAMMVTMVTIVTMVMTVTTLTSTAHKPSGGTLVSQFNLLDLLTMAIGLPRTPGVLVGVKTDMSDSNLQKVLVLLALTVMLPHQTSLLHDCENQPSLKLIIVLPIIDS